MKSYLLFFIFLFQLINSACGQTFSTQSKELDTLATKIQTAINKGEIADYTQFQYVYRVNRKVVGLEKWQNGDWDVYFRDSPRLEDSISYEVSVRKHPFLDTVVVDVYYGRKIDQVWFDGPLEIYGDFRGGMKKFTERASTYLQENLPSARFKDTVVLFFDAKHPSDLLLAIGTNREVEKAFTDFLIEGEMHRPGLWYGVASSLMYSSHSFVILSDKGEIEVDYVGTENFVSLDFDDNNICGISYWIGMESIVREDFNFFYDRKLPLAYYKEQGFLKEDDLLMKCVEGFFSKKPHSGAYYISTFKR